MMWSSEDEGLLQKDMVLCLITGMPVCNSKISCTVHVPIETKSMLF